MSVNGDDNQTENGMMVLKSLQVRIVALILVMWALIAEAGTVDQVLKDVVGVPASVVLAAFFGAVFVLSFQQWPSAMRAMVSLVGFTACGVYVGPWLGPAVAAWVAKWGSFPHDLPSHLGQTGGAFLTSVLGQAFPDLVAWIRRKTGASNGSA